MAVDPAATKFLKYLLPLIICVALWVRFQPTVRGWLADFAAPFLEGGNEADWHVQHGGQLSRSKVELVKEIDELQRKLENHELAQRDLRLLEEENDQLRQQLELRARTRFKLVAASILASDTATGGRTYVIDRGEEDGVVVGQPVMRGGNLDGRVTEVAKRTARIVRLTDPHCKVSVRVQGTPATGVLEGRGENRWLAAPWCQLTYLPRDVTYTEDMVVETSELGVGVPAGIPVGVLRPMPGHPMVESVDELYKNAWVQPYTATDPERYAFVLVVVASMPAETRAALSSIPEANP